MRPVLFRLPTEWLGLPPLPIYGFGFMLVACFAVGLALAIYRARRYGLDREHVIDLGLYSIVAGVVGARLAFLIWDYEANPASETPFLDMAAIWDGGFTFQGGMILALAVVAWYLSAKHIGMGRAMDTFAPSLAIGAGLGRFGCFLNSCCWGRLAEPGSGVVFAEGSDVARWQEMMSHNTREWTGRLAAAGYAPGEPLPDLPLPVVPTQLYEMAALILLGLLLLVLDRLWRKRPAGMLMLACLAGYSLFRFGIEFARDDTPLLLAYGGFAGLKLGQWLALATFAVTAPLAAALLAKGEWLDFSRGDLPPLEQ